MITGTGTGTGRGTGTGITGREVIVKVSVTSLVAGTRTAIEAGAGLKAVVKVLVIVENVEGVNMMIMRDVDEVGLMEGISLTQSYI